MPLAFNVASHSAQLFESDESLASRTRRDRARRALLAGGGGGDPPGRPLSAGGKVLAVLVPDRDPPRKTAFLAESSGAAREVDLENGRTENIFKHAGPVTCLALYRDRDGKEILLTGSWDKTVKRWDVAARANVGTFAGHSDFVKCLAVSADGRTAWSGSADSTIREWDLAAGGGERRVLKGHTRSVEDLRFAPAAARGAEGNPAAALFSCSSDCSVRQWDAATGAEVRRFDGHLTSVYALCLGDDELWSGSADKTARRWDLETGGQDASFEHPDFVKCLLQIGPYLVTGCRDEAIRVFDIASGKCLRKIEGHFDEVSCMAAAGGTLFTASLDGTLRRWRIQDIAEQRELEASAAAKKAPQSVKPRGAAAASAAAMTAEEEAELAELMEEE